MSTLESIQTWGQKEDAFQLGQVRRDGADGWGVDLTARDEKLFAVTLRKDASDPRVWVSHRVDVPAQVVHLAAQNDDARETLRQTVAAIENIRGGTVSCTVNALGRTATVDIVATLYEDGFSRYQRNAAVMELVKARRTLLPRFTSLVTSSKLLAEVNQVLSDAKQASDKPAPPAPSRRKAVSKPAQSTGSCPKCGETVPPGKSFCTACGARL